MEDNDRGADDGRGGVGPRTTHFYPQKVTFVRDKQHGGIISYNNERT